MRPNLLNKIGGILLLKNPLNGRESGSIQEVQELHGIKAKDCYRFYTDIRRRKNHSRTYFLDRMQEKLNDKMRKNDELKRMRR